MCVCVRVCMYLGGRVLVSFVYIMVFTLFSFFLYLLFVFSLLLLFLNNVFRLKCLSAGMKSDIFHNMFWRASLAKCGFKTRRFSQPSHSRAIDMIWNDIWGLFPWGPSCMHWESACRLSKNQGKLSSNQSAESVLNRTFRTLMYGFLYFMYEKE